MTLNVAELRRLEAMYTWEWSRSDMEALHNALPELLKALEALQQIEGAACDGLEDGGYREALIEIRYAARKSLLPHGGVDVG